jgi:murein DD-endopeptidase MepM/ murein hydrolase activator NlpD
MYSEKTIKLKNILKQNFSITPVLGGLITPAETRLTPFDLTSNNPDLAFFDVTTFEGLDAYARKVRTETQKIPFGGYGEIRKIYTESPHFNNSAENRCVHLGIDLWAEAQTPIFAPLSGQIHSFAYNAQQLDYGATIITEHEVEGHFFWLLFGHLSLASLENLQQGQPLLRGEIFATLGAPHENGGWSPHLHLQWILEIGDAKGDFAGVASRAEAARFLSLCPSPALFCGL